MHLPLLVLSLLLPVAVSAQAKLWAVEKAIGLRYPAVVHLKSNHLAEQLSSPDSSSLLLFDTRPADEFSISHLRGAIRLDPEMDAAEFAAIYGDSLQNKNLVFYCSIGYRSSAFIQRISSAIDSTGYNSMVNLRGGLFRWYNENRPLHAQTQVDTVHPYNEVWGKLLKKKRQ